jgi:hypothetical protein
MAALVRENIGEEKSFTGDPEITIDTFISNPEDEKRDFNF